MKPLVPLPPLICAALLTTSKMVLAVTALVASLICRVGLSASFTNLDFESSTVSPLPPGAFEQVATWAAFPGWTAWLGSSTQSIVTHNGLSIGSEKITILGPHTTYTILEGNFTALLQANPFAGVALSQTGLVPDWAQSLQCVIMLGSSSLVYGPPTVSIGGSSVPFVLLSTNGLPLLTPIVVGANVSAWRGQVEELRIGINSGPEGMVNLWLDSISFSPDPIPEPGVLALLLCGGLVVGLWRWRKRSRS